MKSTRYPISEKRTCVHPTFPFLGYEEEDFYWHNVIPFRRNLCRRIVWVERLHEDAAAEWCREMFGPKIVEIDDKSPDRPGYAYWTDGRWDYLHHSKTIGYEGWGYNFMFMNSEDAFAFKMRWG